MDESTSEDWDGSDSASEDDEEAMSCVSLVPSLESSTRVPYTEANMLETILVSLVELVLPDDDAVVDPRRHPAVRPSAALSSSSSSSTFFPPFPFPSLFPHPPFIALTFCGCNSTCV